MLDKLRGWVGPRKPGKAQVCAPDSSPAPVQKVPRWIWELVALALLVYLLRCWLNRRDRRVAFPAETGYELPLYSKPWAAEAPDDKSAAPEPDDLRLIEGVGPKVAALLNGKGITTFRQLAASTEAELRQVLKAARLPMINPATWPEQARLAAAGQWDGLKTLQAGLKGGQRK